MPEGTELGMYHEDTRFLSRYELLLDDEPPVPLMAQASDSFAATYFLTNRNLRGVPREQLGIIRRRRVTDGLHEDLEITNYGDREAVFEVELVVDADFAHLFEVRRKVEVKGAPVTRKGSYRLVVGEDGYSLHFRYKQGSLLRRLATHLSQVPTRAGGRFKFALRLAPRERWQLHLDFVPLDTAGRADGAHQNRPDLVERLARQESAHAALLAQAPRIEADNYLLARAYEQSVQDFIAVRIVNDSVSEDDYAVAAGIPWFMTLFGRDSLIAAYQALPFYPEAAKGTLRACPPARRSRGFPARGGAWQNPARAPLRALHRHAKGHPALSLLRLHRCYAAVPNVVRGGVDRDRRPRLRTRSAPQRTRRAGVDGSLWRP